MISESMLLLLLPFVEIDRLIQNELRWALFNDISTLPQRNTVHILCKISFGKYILLDLRPLILDQIPDFRNPTHHTHKL